MQLIIAYFVMAVVTALIARLIWRPLGYDNPFMLATAFWLWWLIWALFLYWMTGALIKVLCGDGWPVEKANGLKK